MADVYALLPTAEGKIDFEFLDCNVSGPDVSVVDDDELHFPEPLPVLELNGMASKVHFFTDSSRSHLAMHVKGMKKFMSITVVCANEEGKEFAFEITNKSSQLIMDNISCKLPMQLGDGWQFVDIDFADFMANAFRATFASIREVTVSGSCRIAKLYMQRENYADIQLPPYLRVVNLAD